MQPCTTLRNSRIYRWKCDIIKRIKLLKQGGIVIEKNLQQRPKGKNGLFKVWNQRRNAVVDLALLGIFLNLVLAVTKLVIGVLDESSAVESDALNNVTDCAFFIIAVLGTIWSEKEPSRKHPFGYGRLEYITNLAIGGVVLAAGLEAATDAVGNISSPPDATYSWNTVIVLAAAMAIKYLYGHWAQSTGHRHNSLLLEFLGHHAKINALVSVLSICSAISYIVWNHVIDGYIEMIIAIIILKVGFDIVKDTVNKLLGQPLSREKTQEIYGRIKEKPLVIDCHDLIVNNYGAFKNIGSVNIEVSRHLTAGEIYPVVHKLQVELYKEFGIQIVFGIYAIDVEDPMYKAVHKVLEQFKEEEPSCIGCHGLVIEDGHTIFCDVVLDFNTSRKEAREKLEALLSQHFPEMETVINIESEFHQ